MPTDNGFKSPSPKNFEKRVSGVYAPGIGLTFSECEEDIEVSDYYVPILDDEDAQSFRDEWEVNLPQYAQKLEFNKSKPTEWLSHKDLALLVAVEASAHITKMGVSERFSFSIRTNGQSLILQLADKVLELGSGGARSAQSNEFHHLVRDREAISPAYPIDPPVVRRSFHQDFESERLRSDYILTHLRSSPWPDPQKELSISGHCDAGGNIHIDSSRSLRENIKRDFHNEHFAFFHSEGCSLSVFENGPEMGNLSGQWALHQPQATCEVIDHVRLTVFGIDRIFKYVHSTGIAEQFVFIIRTYGRSIRIDMLGIVHLSFVFTDSSSGDDMIIELDLPTELLEELEDGS